MRVLLDENMPHTLRHHLHGHETTTAAYAGFAGLKNGKLLDAAENAAFEVLVSGDQTVYDEQNLSKRRIAIVLLSAVSWPVIESYVARIAAAIDAATPGTFTRVECGVLRRS